MDLGISTNPTPELYTIRVTGEIDISEATQENIMHAATRRE